MLDAIVSSMWTLYQALFSVLDAFCTLIFEFYLLVTLGHSLVSWMHFVH